jgi:hypothetical protein
MTPRLLILLVALALAGCTPINTARRVIQAQAPGSAAGAGAVLTGPTNSATGSAQEAERLVSFQLPGLPIPSPSVPEINVGAPGAERSPIMPAPRPAWIYERSQTTLGAHQDAAGIMKVAATLSGWSSIKWIGLICILACVGGLLWSHGNPDGYPVVFWKVGGVGLCLILVGDHPAWLLLLLIPLAFYAVQKMNLLRIP